MTFNDAIAKLAALGLQEINGWPLLGGQCPVVCEAKFDESYYLYFRARDDRWRLNISHDDSGNHDLFMNGPYGKEYDAGYMTPADAAQIIEAAVRLFRMGKAAESAATARPAPAGTSQESK